MTNIVAYSIVITPILNLRRKIMLMNEIKSRVYDMGYKTLAEFLKDSCISYQTLNSWRNSKPEFVKHLLNLTEKVRG